MNKLKITANIILSKGIFMVALGVFHIIALFTFVKDDFINQLSPEMYREFAFWFAVGGILFIFAGTIEIYIFRSLKQGNSWSWQLAIITVVFSIVSSSMGIIIFKEGPPFLIFGFGLLALVPLIIFRKEFKNENFA